MVKAIKVLILTLLAVAFLILVLVIDLSPSIKVSSSQQVDFAETVPTLIDELRHSLRKRYESQQINVTAEQANSLSGFINRAREQADAQVKFSAQELTIAGSYKLESFFIPIYLNIEAVVLPGNGLILDQVTVGDLPLPGGFALSIAESLANAYTSSLVATKAIASVKSVALTTDSMQVTLAPIDSFLRELKNIETGGSDDDTRILKIRIAHYLRLLDGLYLPVAEDGQKYTSLGFYLHELMKEAAVLSKQSSATLENEAAILALAIYAGSGRFTALVGDLSFAIEKVPLAPLRPALANRQDLSLHFIFSAAIKLMSEKGISIAVGEFKELMDRRQGGSGYSFVDLAADLSGTHFADIAVNPKHAQNVQQIMASSNSEHLFMVSIEELDEGLNKEAFSSKYTGVDSPEYQQVVSEINKRISNLPISQ